MAFGPRGYGSAEVLLREVGQPPTDEDEVLVQVRAAEVDPGVWICMTGRPCAARVAFGLPAAIATPGVSPVERGALTLSQAWGHQLMPAGAIFIDTAPVRARSSPRRPHR
jgi:hypothetical protein